MRSEFNFQALSLLLLIASGVVFRYFLLPYHEFEDSEERDRRFWVCRAKIKEYDEEFVDEAHRAEAYRFCRDNELVKAAASLGLFSSALHFLVACLVRSRKWSRNCSALSKIYGLFRFLREGIEVLLLLCASLRYRLSLVSCYRFV